MKMNLSIAGCLLALAVAANAEKGGACEKYGKGHEILSNITERFYGHAVAKEQLHIWILKLAKDDANAAIGISAASAQNGEGDCGAVNAAQSAMTAKYREVLRLADAAVPPCTTYPNTSAQVPTCEAKTRPLFKADDEAGLLAEKFVEAVSANPSCSSLDFGDAAKVAGNTQEALFLRLQKKACKRDDRCGIVRVGKLRQARESLQKSEGSGATPQQLGSWAAARPLLFNQKGEATDESSPDHGAENILWHMNTYNAHYGGKSDDDTNLIFVASGKIAMARLLLKPGLCN